MLPQICVVSALLISSGAAAEEMPDFRGIRLGSHATRDQIMHALGATKFVNDPDLNPHTDEDVKLMDEKGIFYFQEKAEDKIGPYCDGKSFRNKVRCRQPHMLDVLGSGHSHGIRLVDVWLEDGIVSLIEVVFDALDQDDFLEEVRYKYGTSGWTSERHPFYVYRSNMSRSEKVEQWVLTKKGRDYTIFVCEPEDIFPHFDRFGDPAYRGRLQMSRADHNF
ncbi:MAG TPA: hypothetical protein VKT22_04215 [Steroidobacteraceae bacterium]|nr:hypothetical protein [Steroidobacteraceae bacterium]